jgi:hypothetical protein
LPYITYTAAIGLVADPRVRILDASCVVSEASTFSNASGGSICLRAPVVDVKFRFDGQFYQLLSPARYGYLLTEGYEFKNDISPMEEDFISCEKLYCLLLGVSSHYEVALVLRMLDCDFQEPRYKRVGLVNFVNLKLFTRWVPIQTLTLV